MNGPISVRLDDLTRAVLEDEARSRGLGLGSYLRTLAVEDARAVRRRRIRDESKAVGAFMAQNPSVRSLCDEVGSSSPHLA